uniref:Reelin n=1 Tax=Callorhinchus milii TaxID=7868 RepID=A0A4W3JKV5_CALMI
MDKKNCFNTWTLLLLVGILSPDLVRGSGGFSPRFAPFFFLCTHHGELEGDGEQGEVLMSLHIAGNPGYYVSGQEYHVTISTSTYFDGLLVTGLYTSTSVQAPQTISNAGFMSDKPFGSQFMCSVVASHVSHLPQTNLSFVWIAPPAGTGCVNFMATATQKGQIIFKDALVQQLCEEGGKRAMFSEVHGSNLILRDDFDSYPQMELNPDVWFECSHCAVGGQCGSIMHGHAVSFCEPYGARELTTVLLNTTTASVLQFSIGSGTCRYSYTDPSIIVSYTKNNSADWFVLEKIRAPSNTSTVIHIIYLPQDAKGENIKFKWKQEFLLASDMYEACWALDNILIINAAHKQVLLEDNLDPVDTGNWLFFPGATVKHSCQSDGNSMYFHGNEGTDFNFATTRDVDLWTESIVTQWVEGFESQPAGWDISGAVIGTECGKLESGSSLVFLKDGERGLCTPFLDTTSDGNLRFYFVMGGGSCDSGESHENDVTLYAKVEGRKEHILELLPLFILFLFNKLQTLATKFCLRQKSHQGLRRNVWSVDFFHILPVIPPSASHLIEFSINMGCGSHQPGNSISLEFSTNHGRSWSLLHMECLPVLCSGTHLPHSTIYSSENYSGWSRITIPLPYAALTTETRFRWRQTGSTTGNMWAVDNVYIGPACYKLCSGRGRCSVSGCKCDPGFSGPGCDMASQTFPTIISESFSSSRLSSYHNFHSIRGAELGFGCGVLSNGKALVFNKDGKRLLITTFLDSTQARFLQFTLRLGSKYVLSTCKPPDQPGEGVLLHYSSDNGITWNLLQHYSYQNYHEPRIISVELPEKARKFGIQFRWWQPYHSGQDEDVWAIDEISMTSVLYNSIALNFTNLVDVTQSLGFYLGNVQPYCSHDWTLSFNGDSKTSSSMRYVETQSMQIGASYMLQFNLVMGCGKPFTLHVDNQIRLEYSTNHGLTWHLVQEECFPSMPSCQEFTSASAYHSSAFSHWRRVTVPLPQKTWSSATRFRWSQNYYTPQDEWALDDIYIGQQCPEMCNGHGWCYDGVCKCDPGYGGLVCTPESTLSSTVMCDFENETAMRNDWQEVIGGEIVKPEQGCGVISSGSSLYFFRHGVRQLVSWDLDTQWVDFIQFYIRIGGTTGSCNLPDSREEGVLLQYSNNGGITWHLLSEMYFSDFSESRFVYFEVPTAARTAYTRFRWWQPVHSGEGYDQWALDDIIILSGRQKQIIPVITPTIQQDYTSSYDIPLSQLSIWLMLANEGMGSNETFCAMTHSAMVFGKSDGDRFAVTRDLSLKPGYLLQFKLNIGCQRQFSSATPVFLQYSHDAGRSWSLVKEGCYPASPGVKGCEGSSRELREPTVFYTGDYETWTRITVIIPRSVASSKTRFRWIQETSIYRGAPAFGLDEVYISEPCYNYCSGHGDCISGVCFCDLGYTADQGTCVPTVPNPSEMIDRFEDKLSPLWARVTGGVTGTGCGVLNDGKSLYYSGSGGREARTASLDTTNIRLVQFYIQIGSKTFGSSCGKPRDRNEGIVVQYTNDNGVTWSLLRELDYMSFLDPQIITIELPPEAKTLSTAFRWWQPQHGKLGAQWALDDVLIGMNDSSLTDFQDAFNDSTDLQTNWYRIQGGRVDQYCLSKDTALFFSADIGKPRFAETWDFHVTVSSFLQFDLNLGCGSHSPDSHGIELQYSLNTGKDWHLVIEECVPPSIGCLHYTESSVYTSQRFKNWKRVTVYLSPGTISPRTRFRWIQTEYTYGTDNWAIDNVILASGCPWMCSGHGICDIDRCICDSGFGGRNCVPILPLPSILKDDFNDKPHTDLWPEVLGGERGNLNGEIIKSGSALIFKGDRLRMLVSRDLECTNTLYIQFSFKFIAKEVPDRSHSILLQYSINGGITWHLMDEFYFPQTTEVLFINVPLPHTAQTNATRFRLWQPHNDGNKEEIWIIDDLIIDGNNIQNPGILLDTFDFGPKEENWLFYPGGNIGLYCPYASKGVAEEDSAMVFVSNAVGEHSITTRDLDVNENTIVQFEINVGCNMDSSALDPVRLEFSRDFGATWHLLLPLCYSSGHISALCSTELHPSSTYYAGTTQGWKREVIHFGRLHLCGSVRFRWYQGFYRMGSQPVTWAIDNTYIGPQCEEMCNGHGSCINGTRCICDSGYSGPTCKTSSKNIDFLKGEFQGPVEPEKFLMLSGGKPSRKCGLMSSGNSLFFSEEGLRMLMTVEMDLSQARFVQFFLRLGCGKASPDPRSQPVLLQYSLNGGLSWGLFQEFLFSNNSNVGRYIALHIPLKARSSSTRLRWWQPSENGHFYSPWAIDHIVIGGSITGDTVMEDDFSRLDSRKWLLHPGGTKMAVCGSSGDSLVFIEKAYTRYLISTDVVVNEDSFLQFDFAASCSVTDSCYTVELQYSVDLGLSWHPLLKDCLPSNVECNKYHLQRILVSDTFNKWSRITLPLPPYTRSLVTRFRWYQQAPFEKQQTWALDNVYIGDSCVDMCTGHGRCSQGSCICDEPWSGLYCDEPKSALPVRLKDNFNKAPSSSNWLTVNGGKLSTVCGSVASGLALHFSGGCSRQLITVDLNLTNAEFIQFYFMYGCLVLPGNRDQGVFLDYSVNGGITWNLLMEIFYNQYNKPSFVSILLPPEARTLGTRFRWRQLKHYGHEQGDWALDNVLIAGSASERTFMLDTFSPVPIPLHDRSPSDSGPMGRVAFMFEEEPMVYEVNEQWMFHDDCLVERFCDSQDAVMVCGSQDGREVHATTYDLTPSEGWIMQFKISVGCRSTEKLVQNQVHIQYSVDFGVTWRYLVSQCLPADPQCSSTNSQPSAFFPAKGWKRVIYPLQENLMGNAARFRLYQKYSDTQWGIDNFYVGPACPDNCRGHGDCLNRQCFCDPGFTGPNCYLSHSLKTSLKERFETDDLKTNVWMSLEGGSPCTDCGLLVEDLPLYFSGAGMRQAITADLDLRGTKFVQYWARIGSENNMTTCHRPTCRKEGVLLDFSTDGGITWHLLHEMDYQKYISVRQDYVLLPENAHSNTTRLRWWQPFLILNGQAVSSAERAQWALDNVLIGGSEINPSQLMDSFDDEGVNHDENWTFYPNAVRTAGFCGNPSFHLYWPNKKKDETYNFLESRELIVAPGYILQFRIVVGCEVGSCGELQPVSLQYSKDGRKDSWSLVQTECLPSTSNNVGCSPFQFHEASIYSSVNSSSWSRVTIQLSDYIASSATQFRWIQKEGTTEKQSWAIDNVYIGEPCSRLCSGHGYCRTGTVCICDEGYQGDDCANPVSDLPSYIKDNFESTRVTELNWQMIQGGLVGSGCGQLVPYAHGDSLYFNGCQTRQAATRALDLTRASKIMFVLQIGSTSQTASCNTDLTDPNITDKAVLLQYSMNGGITWHVIAHHLPKDFIRAQRISYNIPLEARVKGVQLRWWQARHNGTGRDQWALDHVEVVLTRKQNYMMNFSRQHMLRHYYNRRRRSLHRSP